MDEQLKPMFELNGSKYIKYARDQVTVDENSKSNNAHQALQVRDVYFRKSKK